MKRYEEKHDVLVVDGNIASGKTTYVNMLVNELTKQGRRVTVISEPVDKWEASGLLETFYSDVQRWGYLFQSAVFQSRIAHTIDIYQRTKDVTDIYILERSCVTDIVFMKALHRQGKVTDLELSCYHEWASMWQSLMPITPTIFLYIDTGVRECMDRRTLRDRSSEQDIPKEYFEILDEEHRELFSKDYIEIVNQHVTYRVPVCRVDVTKDHRTDIIDRQRLLDQVVVVVG